MTQYNITNNASRFEVDCSAFTVAITDIFQ